MNDVNPTVSILCLCYNQQMFVVESLESIKAQSYQNFEILICDDFSKDNSVETIEHWIQQNTHLNIQFIKHSENIGITKTLNELLYLSKGTYIQILALDDILLTDKLGKHIEILSNSKKNEALVFSDAKLMDDNSKILQNKFIGRHISITNINTQNIYELLLEGNFIPAMSALIKRKFLIAENGWDESLSYEDYDMWLRLSKKYYFIFDTDVSCIYRLHKNNSYRNNSVINNATIFQILFKHKENNNVREKIFVHLEKIYLQKALKNENKMFFDHYKIQSFSETFIKYNLKTVFYKLALRFHKLYFYLKNPH
jgi:glycosyltransferase involved in cell wall biosynthesis